MITKINSNGHKALSTTNLKYNQVYIGKILLSVKWKI